MEAEPILELKYLAAHYTWAVAEYKRHVREGVDREELDRFRKWIIEPAKQRFEVTSAME